MQRRIAVAAGATQTSSAGKPPFNPGQIEQLQGPLLFRHEWPLFIAFESLEVDGEDIRCLPLHFRKVALKRIMPRAESRPRYLDHIESREWLVSAST
jgi:hypothetical protein